MKLRVARHTNDIEQIRSFYLDILGLELLGGFEDHKGYDGVFLGKANLGWHLEFTKSRDIVDFNYGDEDYLVFYPENDGEYQSILNRISESKIKYVVSKNPFWNSNGKIILDPDGFQIIISNLKSL